MTSFREWVENDPNSRLSSNDIENLLNTTSLGDFDYSIGDFDVCEFEKAEFPVKSETCMILLFLIVWLEEPLPTNVPDYSPQTNYDYFKDTIYGRDAPATKDAPFGSLYIRCFSVLWRSCVGGQLAFLRAIWLSFLLGEASQKRNLFRCRNRTSHKYSFCHASPRKNDSRHMATT